jgi:serine/threonine protein kinase
MAHDTILNQDVALNVPTLTSNTVDSELAIHNEIRHRAKDSSKLLLSHHFFSISCPDRRHTVLVLNLRGHKLNSTFSSMSMADRISAVKQVLQALECLYDADFVHRGPFLPPTRLMFSALTLYRSERQEHTLWHRAP